MAKLLIFATDVDVIAAKQRDRYKIEIHVQGKGGGLVVVEESRDLEDFAPPGLRGPREKAEEGAREAAREARRGGRERKDPGRAGGGRLAGRGRAQGHPGRPVTVKPMTVDEAVMAFDAKKREVLMFRPEEGGWAVLYRRKDGHIGLVEPE